MAAADAESSVQVRARRSRWSLRARIFAQFFAAILPLVALLIYEVHAGGVLVRDVDSGLTLSQLGASSADGYREFMNGVTDAVDTGHLSEAARDALHRVHAELTQLLELHATDAERGLLATITRIDQAVSVDGTIKTLMASRKDINAADAGIKTVVGVIDTELHDRVTLQRSQGRRQSTLSIVFAVIILAGLMIFLHSTVRQITQPIATAVSVAQRVTAGDLTGDVHVERRDEFGDLQEALFQMHYALSDIVSEVRHGSAEIAHASTDIAEGTTDLARRTESQMEGVARISASANELRLSVTENTTASAKASEVARGTTELATRGGAMVGQVVQTMQAIHSGSKQVVEFIGAIENIAFRTNILALNAAVEAARAGESGRAFAVVAGEVRDLANRSAQIAKEARELISRTFVQVEDGAKLVEQTGNTMQQIVAANRTLADTVETVLAASQNQQRGAEEVAGIAEQITGMTRENTEFVKQSEEAAVGLRERAESLSHAVGRFKLLRPVRAKVNLAARVLDSDGESLAHVSDISAVGLQLETQRPIEPGQCVLIRLQLPAGSPISSALIEAQVVRRADRGMRLPCGQGLRLRKVAAADRDGLRAWLVAVIAAESKNSSALRTRFGGLADFDRLPSMAGAGAVPLRAPAPIKTAGRSAVA